MKIYIILLLTLTLRILSEINFPALTSDNAALIEAAKNFSNDSKFSNSWVESADLSVVKSESLARWPIGHSSVIAGLNLMTNNLIYAEILFQCLGVLILILGFFKILRYLHVSSYIIQLFLILFAFNSAPFLYLGPTDLFTASIFIWVVYFTILELNSTDFSYRNILIISFLSFLAATFRYACIPNLMIIPLVFLIFALIKKNKKFLFKGGVIAFIGLILTFTYLHFFPVSSGRTNAVDSFKTATFYFSHLKWFDPFIVRTFFYMAPIEYRLPSNSLMLVFYRLAMLVGSASFLLYVLSVFIKKINLIAWIKTLIENKIKKNDSLIIIFISTFLIVVSFLSFQSLTVAPESDSFGPPWMPPFWTYVYCTRYFIYVMILFTLLFFVAFNERKINKTKSKIIFNIIYFVSLGFSIFYWGFTQYQFYATKGNGAGSEWVNEGKNIITFNVINTVKSLEPNTHIVYSHFKKKHRKGLITNYANSYATDAYDDIIAGKFSNSDKLILIMSMPSALSHQELQFLKTHQYKLLHAFQDEYVIKFYL